MNKKLVDRFLSWLLPKTFSPDCGISFQKPSHPHAWPIGTNLLIADEAQQMLEHVLMSELTDYRKALDAIIATSDDPEAVRLALESITPHTEWKSVQDGPAGCSMNDLEMTRLCAEAMGLTVHYETHFGKRQRLAESANDGGVVYDHFDPLHDDAQAMALVKKFKLEIVTVDSGENGWQVFSEAIGIKATVRNLDLNRAICECVANMQSACG